MLTVVRDIDSRTYMSFESERAFVRRARAGVHACVRALPACVCTVCARARACAYIPNVNVS